jgi:hydrogenase maturation protein HypF
MRCQQLNLPRAGGGAVLALGAWLKNTACLLKDGTVYWSELHGDLGEADNCIALEQSVEELIALANGTIVAVAHDLHPDFFSTRLAQEVAARLGVPAIPVQHHHAHIAAVMAEHGVDEAIVGMALDGVGLGTDGVAWGGELLRVDPAAWTRAGHFRALALPGGDIAAREPWRMAAAVLHTLGRQSEIVPRFGPQVGEGAARTVQAMLERNFNCPPSTGAGRWFDAAAGALGICMKQAYEAEAAIALEKRAAAYLAEHGVPAGITACRLADDGVLDLLPVLEDLLEASAGGNEECTSYISRAAAAFHVALADAMVEWAAREAGKHGMGIVALGGGCFFNRVMTERVTAGLTARGLRVLLPREVSCGDAGLALGQAWYVWQQADTTAIGTAKEALCA